MSRFWIKINTFAARFTLPAITTPAPGGEPGGPPVNDLPPGGGSPWFRLPRTTLIDMPLSELRTTTFPDRAWWDQRGENNPWPADPPEHLDLSGIDTINNNWR
jgi:hypothetical protein